MPSVEPVGIRFGMGSERGGAMGSENRRQFLASAGLGLGLGWSAARAHGGQGSPVALAETGAVAQDLGQRPPRPPAGSACSTPAIECHSA